VSRAAIAAAECTEPIQHNIPLSKRTNEMMNESTDECSCSVTAKNPLIEVCRAFVRSLLLWRRHERRSRACWRRQTHNAVLACVSYVCQTVYSAASVILQQRCSQTDSPHRNGFRLVGKEMTTDQ